MQRFIRELLRQERGATAVEYGLIIALVFLAAVAGITQFTDAANDMFLNISSTVEDSME